MSDWLEIHALADNELDAKSKAEARKAVEGSPAAASEYRSVQTVKETLASKAVQAEVSDAWKKCRGRLDEIDKTHRAESFVGRFSWALSGLFVVALVSTAIYNRTVNPQALRTGDVARMVAGLAPQYSSSQGQPQDMSTWVKSSPVTLDTGSLKVMAYAEGHYREHPVAMIQLSDREGNLALVVVRGAGRLEGGEPMLGYSGYQSGQIDTLNFVAWQDRGYSLMIMGPRPHEDLRSTAESIRLR